MINFQKTSLGNNSYLFLNKQLHKKCDLTY